MIKFKKPISLLLVFMMIVSLFTVVPISASAAEYGAYDSGWLLSDDSDSTATLTAINGANITKLVITRADADKDPVEKVDGVSVPSSQSGNVFTFDNLSTTEAPTEPATDAPLSYTVTWMNDDEVLETDTGLAPGALPSFDGATPTKAEDDDYTYAFNGWTFGLAFYEPDSLPIVDGDTTYVASFMATAKYEPGYYVVGNFTDWKVDPAYKLTANPENEGEYMFNDLALTTTDGFKIVYAEAGKDKTRYPEGMGNDMTVAADGSYNIYFRPDGQGGEDWHECVIYAERVIPEDVIAVINQINALPAVITTDNMKDFDDVYAAYQALTDTQKKYVDQNNVEKLNNAMLAEVVVDKVSKLPENVTLADWATVVVAGGYYDSLDDAAKAFIGKETLDKLTAAQKTIADLQAAEAFSDQINALPAKDDVTYDDKDEIEEARAAYEALTADQKALIEEDTYKKLTDAEDALNSLILLGDVDGDGRVTVIDATLILRSTVRRIVLTEDQVKAADVDGDGIVTVVDATLVQRYATSVPVVFPIGEYV